MKNIVFISALLLIAVDIIRSQEITPTTILKVEEVRMRNNTETWKSELDALKIKDENGDIFFFTASTKAEMNRWFINATVEKYTDPVNTIIRAGREGDRLYIYIGDDAKFKFVFKAGGKNYSIGVGVGTKFFVQKTQEGKYILLTEETAKANLVLETGDTPYAYCYGANINCNTRCSQIKVKTPSNSDVLVTLKQKDRVVAHAYISANNTYTFQIPNGTYQPFFYYGDNWDSEIEMTQTNCGMLRGGFAKNEQFGKDTPQTLNNNVLTYELILQQSGNFSTIPSNKNETF